MSTNTGHPFHSSIPDPGTLVDAGIYPSLQAVVEMMGAAMQEIWLNPGIPQELTDYLQDGLTELIRLRDAYVPVIEGEVL